MTASSRDGDFEYDRLANVVAAFALALTDKINEAMRAKSGRSQTSSAALIQVGFSPEGLSIEGLRSMIGLTHSATVRVVDQLEADGLVTRQRNVGKDLRVSVLQLTAAGTEEMSKSLSARQDVGAAIVRDLSVDDLQKLAGLIDRMVPAVVDFGDDQDIVCRLCDIDICPQDRCPVNTCVLDTPDREGAGP
jgi:MarR family transcriptional repressor of emrRAB